MRCTILATGTRGDVQPLLAVGVGLQRAGVRVRFATYQEFAPVVEAQGIEHFALAGRSSSFFRGPAGAAFRNRTRSAEDFTAFFERYLSVAFGRTLNDFWLASRDADVVLAITVGVPSLAERLGIPVFIAAPYPMMHMPTGAFPNPYSESAAEPGSWLARRRSWRMNDASMGAFLSAVNAWRRASLGLPPTTAKKDLAQVRRLPHLMGYSPVVLPRPRDWRPWVHVTGYWFLEDTGDPRPTPELERFVAAGPPPIGIGFSSLVGPNARVLTDAILDALARTGQRAVLVTGLGGLKRDAWPDTVHAVDWVPYTWLLPRLAAMIHHGGAGSTAAAIRYGLPQIGMPFGYDQMLWTDRVHALGAGPAPIRADSADADAVTRAIDAVVRDPRYRARAHALRDQINAEDGVAEAVRLVIETVDRHPRRATAC